MALSTAKQALVMFEDALDTFTSQDAMLPLVDLYVPEEAEMQNSGNVVIRPVRQQRPSISGWDLTGQEQGIIKQAYMASLGDPVGDLIQVRADDLRDKSFFDEAGVESGRKQISVLNSALALAIKTNGSLFYRSNDSDGYSFISEAQVQMNERQLRKGNRNFMFNDRDARIFGKDLSQRQTVSGRAESVWKNGLITEDVAEFNIYSGSFLPNIAGGADPATTVTGNQSFAPQAGTVTTGSNGANIVTNNDYRYATIAVAASANYNVGDKVQIKNGGVPVYALGKDSKDNTGQAMVFSVVSKPDGTSLMITPRPIAADDPALTTLEKSYANIDTRILNAATVNRINTDTSKRANLFWEKSSVEVLGGTIPARLMAEYDGMKVLSETMPNGLTMYMLYDGDIVTMDFRYRIFVWYNVTVKDPANCGVCVTF